MTISEDLINEGVAIQDPTNPDRIVFTVNIPLPKVAVDKGGVDDLARRFGWTPEVADKDEEGNTKLDENKKAVMVPNPVSSAELMIAATRKFWLDNHKANIAVSLEKEKREKEEAILKEQGLEDIVL